MTANLPPAIFIADAIGLDFLNSIATPADTPVDWIADGEGYLRWLEQAGLVPVDVLRHMRARARPGELDKLAGEARSLREWFRDFVRRHKGQALTATALAELEPLNRLLEKNCSFSQIALQPDGQHVFMVQSVRRWPDTEALLLPVAEALARLVSTEDFALVKACEGPTCTLLFADHTRGHARRWCSMAICGNRAKQAAHRHRRKMHGH
ncbi:MAG TPA: ABATE domain-containing protein [Rhizomicrobium sp.]|nr:ABATE domain-containing protein [Rhizomicrobium sp.]